MHATRTSRGTGSSTGTSASSTSPGRTGGCSATATAAPTCVKFAWTKIVRHQLVKGTASPDDPALARYWADRRRKKPPPPLDKRGLRLLKAQHGRCPVCGDFLLHADHEPQTPREWEQWLTVTRKAIYHQWITPEATTIGNDGRITSYHLLHSRCLPRHRAQQAAERRLCNAREPTGLA